MNSNAKTQTADGKSKPAMPSDLLIVLGTATFAVLFGAGMMWALIKENTHPAWFWVILGFSVLMFVILTTAFLPSRESKLADSLGASSQAGRATGRVVQMRRLSTRESTLRETSLSSEERRVGKECVRTYRSRWSTSHEKKQKKRKTT